MRFFVVIVSYNSRKWINRCLSSLRISTIKLVIIVIDNNSTDNSQLIIKEIFPEVDLIQLNKNLGFGQANNIGIRKAYDEGADYVFLLNQDAWVEPNTLEKLVHAHQKEKEYGIISPIHLNGKGDGLDLSFSEYICPKYCANLYSDKWLNKLDNKIYEVDFVNAAAWLLSRECISKVGGFSPIFFHYGEDINYIHRGNYFGFKTGIYPHVVVYHDREQKKNSIYFSDKSIQKERLYKLKMSNPNIDGYRLVRRNIISELIKKMILFRYQEVKIIISLIFKINKMTKDITNNLELSKKEGLSFL